MRVRLILIAALMGLGLSLAACSSGSTQSTPTTGSSPYTASQTAYLQSLNNAPSGDFATLPVVTLLNLGEDVCNDLGSGTTVAEEAQSMLDASQSVLTPSDLGYLMGAAVENLCSQYLPEVQAYLNANG